MKIAIVRGKFLNQYEMQFFEPLSDRFDITAFGSCTCFHDRFAFPVIKLPSPMDLPEFPFKMPFLNRVFIDAHYLFGLETQLKGFDLVHSAETYFHYTQQCLNAKKMGYVKKVIATVLENIPFNNEGIPGRKAFKARARRELDHMIALTNKTKAALLLEGADPSKITVIPHFIDTGIFFPTQNTLERRKKNRKHLTVLFSGRLEWEKGVLDLLQAARQLLRDPDVGRYTPTFLFVGHGSLYTKMRRQEHEYSIDRYCTHVQVPYSRMNAMYNEADIFVAPSKPTPTYQEQYCTALLEAQAAGLPIVTTKSGGIPENVGNAAVLIEPGNVAALVQEMKAFILQPKKRILYGKRARNRAITVHDAKIGAEKIAALYTSLQ